MRSEGGDYNSQSRGMLSALLTQRRHVKDGCTLAAASRNELQGPARPSIQPAPLPQLNNVLPALLLLHGNSSSSRIWRHIQDSVKLKSRWRIIAFDLPGHGSSSDAPDPERSYTQRGYAELAVHILEHLKVESVVVLGWSLGGHAGIEMVPLLKGGKVSMKGLMIVGAPPALGPEQLMQGFLMPVASPDATSHMILPGKRDWTGEETVAFSHATAGEPFEQWMEDCARRTDGRARECMFAAFVGGVGVDQRRVVEEEENVLLAAVNGGEEPFVNLDYLDRIVWKRLWRGECVRMEGLGHAPFWERPEVFEGLLGEFLEDCNGG
jgi:pimeloyl-ACP methyl ester carboxylesterase